MNRPRNHHDTWKYARRFLANRVSKFSPWVCLYRRLPKILSVYQSGLGSRLYLVTFIFTDLRKREVSGPFCK